MTVGEPLVLLRRCLKPELPLLTKLLLLESTLSLPGDSSLVPNDTLLLLRLPKSGACLSTVERERFLVGLEEVEGRGEAGEALEVRGEEFSLWKDADASSESA